MPSRVLVLGATGTIGRATVRALLAQGHEVVCLIRQRGSAPAITGEAGHREFLSGATVRPGDATDPVSLARDGFKGERFDVLVS
ncbi:MAG: NAD-dependent epimerase/dehydratase family protein, partial [bacterium]